MIVKKVPDSSPLSAQDDVDICAAMLEPLPGRSDQEVVAWLTREGASDVSILAPGFISAVAPCWVFNAAKVIAYVHIKPRKQLH